MEGSNPDNCWQAVAVVVVVVAGKGDEVGIHPGDFGSRPRTISASALSDTTARCIPISRSAYRLVGYLGADTGRDRAGKFGEREQR